MFALTPGLILSCALTVLASAATYKLNKQGAFDKLSYLQKQILIGILFGACAAAAIFLGNNRVEIAVGAADAAPLAAGLIFGAPAGIIAGAIGAIVRFCSRPLVFGIWTYHAETISLLLSGLYAGVLNWFVFDRRRPDWPIGFAAGLVISLIHMSLILMTNADDTEYAMYWIKEGYGMFILPTALTVSVSIMAAELLSGGKLFERKQLRHISQQFQVHLLGCVIVATGISFVYTVNVETTSAISSVSQNLSIAIADVQMTIERESNENMLGVTREIMAEVLEQETILTPFLQSIAQKYDVTDICLVDETFTVTKSNNPGYIGYDMASSAQSDSFRCLLEGEKEYVQGYMPTGIDPLEYRKYVGIALPQGGFIQAGFNADQIQAKTDSEVQGAAMNRHISSDGSVIIIDESGKIVSDLYNYAGQDITTQGMSVDELTTPYTLLECGCYGMENYMMFSETEGYYIVALYPVRKAMNNRDMSIMNVTFMETIIFALLYSILYKMIQNTVVKNIDKVNADLDQITAGNLSVKVDVATNREFAELSEDINLTVDTLKRYIKEAEKRIDEELEVARRIQYTSLPSEFPAFPDRTDLDIYAYMDTAKEVGGDFYDFYFVGEDRLLFLCADVSGKGIPGALFMMESKAVIKSFAEMDLDVNEIMERANNKLCENNESEMFVTAWIGIIDLKTGHVEFANGGHNPPLVKKNGTYQYLRTKPGLVLAAMPGMKYRKESIDLEPDDALYLYTDGVTEAMNENLHQYGEDRLFMDLNRTQEMTADDICEYIRGRVEEYVGDMEQSDDITMLSLIFKPKDKNELKTDAVIDKLETVTKFADKILVKAGAADKVIRQINIVIDEIFSNIANYAYEGDDGKVRIRLNILKETGEAEIIFMDKGLPFNPLETDEPDLSGDAEERTVGGLGIFVVRKTMDAVNYKYKDGINILTIRKKIMEGKE